MPGSVDAQSEAGDEEEVAEDEEARHLEELVVTGRSDEKILVPAAQ